MAVCTCSQAQMCSDFLDAVEEVVRQARYLMDHRPTGRHQGRSCQCDMPATCGNIAWHVFHGVAKAVHDKICPSCGQFAMDAISALHDLVNRKLGKPMYDPGNFRKVASYYAKALEHRVADPGVLSVVRRLPFGSRKEQVYVLYLDSKGQVIETTPVSLGGTAAALVPIHDVLLQANRLGARGIVLVHNHPSGASSPSEEDMAVTRELRTYARQHGIPYVDHVIVHHGNVTPVEA